MRARKDRYKCISARGSLGVRFIDFCHLNMCTLLKPVRHENDIIDFTLYSNQSAYFPFRLRGVLIFQGLKEKYFCSELPNANKIFSLFVAFPRYIYFSFAHVMTTLAAPPIKIQDLWQDKAIPLRTSY